MSGYRHTKLPGRLFLLPRDEKKKKDGSHVSPPDHLHHDCFRVRSLRHLSAVQAKWSGICDSERVPASLPCAAGLQLPAQPNPSLNVNGSLTVARSPIVSRWDRLLIFGALNLAAIVLFVVCFALLPTPIFVINPRKFVVL